MTMMMTKKTSRTMTMRFDDDDELNYMVSSFMIPAMSFTMVVRSLMVIFLMMIISTMGIFLLKWISSLAYYYIYNLLRNKEVISFSDLKTKT